jgi:hypothetical protein
VAATVRITAGNFMGSAGKLPKLAKLVVKKRLQYPHFCAEKTSDREDICFFMSFSCLKTFPKLRKRFSALLLLFTFSEQPFPVKTKTGRSL